MFRRSSSGGASVEKSWNLVRRIIDGVGALGSFAAGVVLIAGCVAAVVRLAHPEGLTMNLRLGAPEWAFLAVLFGGLGMLFFGAGVWAWYSPRRPAVKFRALHGRLRTCRDADRSLLLPTMTPFLSAARAPLQAVEANELYEELFYRLRPLGVPLPHIDASTPEGRAERYELLARLTALASVGNVKEARQLIERVR